MSSSSSSSLDLETIESQKSSLLRISEDLGIKALEDWYGIRNEDIIHHGGTNLLAQYGGSLSELLASLFPEHPWNAARFSNKPRNYWNSIETQRTFMEELGQRLGVGRDLSRWYKISRYEVEENGGRGLLQLYNDSMVLLLSSVFPEHDWDPKKVRLRRKPKVQSPNSSPQEITPPTSTLPNTREALTVNIKRRDSKKSPINKPYNYWKDITNHKKFLLELAGTLGITSLEGWYGVSKEDFVRNGGSYLIRIHNSSVRSLLQSVFPEHDWDASKFSKKPQRHWGSIENVREFLNDLAGKLGFKYDDYEKWYSVRGRQIQEHGGWHLIRYFGSLQNLLGAAYPNHAWDGTKFIRIARHAQSKNARLTEVASSLSSNSVL